MAKPDVDLDGSGYHYQEEMRACHMHSLLLPEIEKRISAARPRPRIFDLGCGNGSTADYFLRNGYEVTGVDPSEAGIRVANKHLPDARLEIGSCYDDLRSKYGTFPVVISLEVVEHVFLPRRFARTLFDLVEDGGTAFVTTPYHGYLKNLALAVTGKLDAHFTALWDYGHIKFWSFRTLSELLRQAGFRKIEFIRLGRIPPLAMSMMAIAKK